VYVQPGDRIATWAREALFGRTIFVWAAHYFNRSRVNALRPSGNTRAATPVRCDSCLTEVPEYSSADVAAAAVISVSVGIDYYWR
jgi:hypothetical protein